MSLSRLLSLPGAEAHGLSGVLSAIDGEVRRQQGVEPVLRLLDSSKPHLTNYLRGPLQSELAAKLLTLKILNLCLAKYHYLARDFTLLSKPYGLIADPVNSCNLACPGCVHSGPSKQAGRFDWNAGMLSEDRYYAFLQRYGPYAIQTTLYNYGEPLLNPNTPKFIRKAKAYLSRTTLSTNMTVKRFDAQAYALSGLDFMTLSVDGATQPVYETFRKKGNLETALDNIHKLVAAKRREGRRSPVLNWQFLAFEHNAHEIGPALDLARTLGVDQFSVATPFDVTWDDPAIRPAANVAAHTYQFRSDSTEGAKENWNPFPLDLDSDAIGHAYDTGWFEQLTADYRPATGPPRRTCHYLYKNMVMDANGRVFPCCAAPRPDADLHFANFEAGGPEAFNAQKYQAARANFQDGGMGTAAPPFPMLPATASSPYCTICDWYDAQLSAHVDRPEVRVYLDASGVFDRGSAQILSSW